MFESKQTSCVELTEQKVIRSLGHLYDIPSSWTWAMTPVSWGRVLTYFQGLLLSPHFIGKSLKVRATFVFGFLKPKWFILEL